ncbi:hypothetical protein [Flagellimonas sp. 2504JD4-2]
MKTFVIILSVAFMQIWDVPNCKCVSTNSIAAEIESSDLVMVGDVIGKNVISKFVRDKDGAKTQIRLIAYKLKVHESYKGIQRDKIIYLYTSGGKASCGIKFEMHKRYIVFGKKGPYLPKKMFDSLDKKEQLSFWINQCSKTQLFDLSLEKEVQRKMNK